MEWNNQEQPWYKRLWFIVVAIVITLVVLIGIIVGIVLAVTKNDENSSWLDFPAEDEIENLVEGAYFKKENIELSLFNSIDDETGDTLTNEGSVDILLYATFDGQYVKIESALKGENIKSTSESSDETFVIAYDKLLNDKIYEFDINDKSNYLIEETNYTEGMMVTNNSIVFPEYDWIQSTDKLIYQSVNFYNIDDETNFSITLNSVMNANVNPPFDEEDIHIDSGYSLDANGQIAGEPIGIYEPIIGEEWAIDKIDRSLSEVF